MVTVLSIHKRVCAPPSPGKGSLPRHHKELDNSREDCVIPIPSNELESGCATRRRYSCSFQREHASKTAHVVQREEKSAGSHKWEFRLVHDELNEIVAEGQDDVAEHGLACFGVS